MGDNYMPSDSAFDIQEYMTRGVERVVKDALRATLKDTAPAAIPAPIMRRPTVHRRIS